MPEIWVASPVSARPQYFERMLDSWAEVRRVGEVGFVFALEPTVTVQRNVELIFEFFKRTRCQVHLVFNNTIHGPAKNHYTALNTANQLGAHFLIQAEEDIIVSDDVLEYMMWARFQLTDRLAVVSAYSTLNEGNPDNVHDVLGFPNCWLWGTDAYHWQKTIGFHWDSDFSTGEGTERGWDWNMARVMRQLNLSSLTPERSRAQNIGEIGWSTGPGSVVNMPTFERHRPPSSFKLV